MPAIKPPDPAAPDRLDTFWDALATGAPPPVDGLNPALAVAVERLHALDRAETPGPRPAFVAGLERELLARAGGAKAESAAPAEREEWAAPPSVAPRPAPPRRPPLAGRPRVVRDRRRPAVPAPSRGDDDGAQQPERAARSVSRPRPAADERGDRRGLGALFSAGLARATAAVFIAAVILGLLLLLRGVPPRAAGRPTAAPTPTAGAATATAPVTPPAAQQTAPGWRLVAPMATGRVGHTATLLRDGRILVAGGEVADGVTASAEIYDPATNRWAPTGSMNVPRSNQTATLLPDGQVLVAGGYNQDHASASGPTITVLDSAERYDPAAGRWTMAAPMGTDRSAHSAVLLEDGQVLVVGGFSSRNNGEPLTTAERYDPAANRWLPAGTLSAGGANAAVALRDGRVLVAGQPVQGASGAAEVDLYDPATNAWRQVAPMPTSRRDFAVAALPDGQVLFAGGSAMPPATAGTPPSRLDATEIYDPATNRWSAAAPLHVPRTGATAMTLSGGNVVVIGGEGQDKPLASAEQFDPTTGRWTMAGEVAAARVGFAATPLPGDRLLVTGGSVPDTDAHSRTLLNTAEIYTAVAGEPATATPPPAPPQPSPATSAPAATYRPMQIARDRTIAAPVLWVDMGQHPDYTPQLAPDGRRVAYFTIGAGGFDDQHVVVHDVAGGADRDVTPAPGYLYSSLRWSPDGQTLALVRTKPGQNGYGPSTSELLVMDADGGNARAIYRRDDPKQPGPDLGISGWSADGTTITVGGTMFGGGFNSPAVAVRADGSGATQLPPRPLPDRARCGLGDGPPEDFHSYIEAPDGSFAICEAKTAALAHPPTNVPLGGYSLVRYDTATKRATVMVSVAGDLTPAIISPDGAWLLVGMTAKNPNPTDYGGQTVRWAVIRRDGTALRDLGGDPFFPVQQGNFTWGADGRGYFMAWPTVAANHVTGYLYELDAATATVRIVTQDWQLSRLLTVSPDGRQILLVRGPARSPELHLLDLAPAANAVPVPTPAPTLAPGQAIVPPEATSAARAFMDARMARDEARARSYLTPDLAARLATADLLPPAEQRWSKAFVVWQERGADGRVTIVVQIPSAKGEFEQSLTLEQRDGRWLVADLGPVENLMPTASGGG